MDKSVGRIDLHRKILEWEWYSDINTCRLFIHMLLKANWKEGKFRGTTVPRGSFVSSLDKLSKETSLTNRELRAAISHLKMTGELTVKTTNRYSVWEEPDKLLLLEAWARDGLTDEQIAGNMGVTARTLYNWKKRSILIFQTLKTNKELADIEVENALRKKALGFRETEQTVTVHRVVEYADGKRVREVSEPVVTEVERYYPPDTTAAIFWLKNRKPEQWRDKQEQKVDLTEAVKIVDSVGDGD